MTDLEKGDSLSGEQEGLVNSGFDISDETIIVRHDKYCSRECSCLRLPRWVRYLLLILLILTYYVFETEYTIYAYDYEDENTTSTENTMARLHHSMGRRTCEEDTDFGCCEIYYNCHIVGNSHIDYKVFHIDIYRIVAHDVLKSNCPSLRTIINQYNQHYGSDDCGEFGCCEDFHDIKCDDTLHTNIFKSGNGPELIDHFKNNTNTIAINVPKIDNDGSNCWNYNTFLSGINHFINKYEHNYPEPEGPCDLWCIFIRILLGCFILGCMIPSMNK